MKYSFSNRLFENAHGEAPRGKGYWAFVLKNVSVESISPDIFIDQNDTIFWVPGIWTLTEAKKRASAMLEANAIPFTTTVYVAP